MSDGKETKVNIVYPYLNPKRVEKKKNFGWELKYSIRSLYKNIDFDFNITIIGDIPDWVNRNVIKCIEFDNNHLNCQRQTKINQKILKAADEYDDFILFNDDIIVMNKISFDTITTIRKLPGKIQPIERSKKNSFRLQMEHTSLKLKDAGYKNYNNNFVTHTPHYYNSDKLKKLNDKFDIEKLSDKSFVLENLYFNAYYNKEPENVRSYRYGVWGQINDIYRKEDILNFDEKGCNMNPWIKESLERIFNEKCKAEK